MPLTSTNCWPTKDSSVEQPCLSYDVRPYMLKRALFIFLVALCAKTYGQEAFPLKELKFQKFFAARAGDNAMYCLLGNGFFRTISSGEEDSAIHEWLSNHPNAKAVPVSMIGEGSKMPIVYFWAVDGAENLNLSLVGHLLCTSPLPFISCCGIGWCVSAPEPPRR